MIRLFSRPGLSGEKWRTRGKFGTPLPAMKRERTLLVTGQALIYHGMHGCRAEGFKRLAERIQTADAAFCNYEGSLAPEGKPPEKGHPAGPETLRDLREMGFDLLSLANNHAVEGGTEGVLHTKAVAEAMGFAAAGTGASLEEAMAPACLDVAGTRIGLVCMDTANLQSRDAVAGEGKGPGVNPLRAAHYQGPEVRLNGDDLERNLEAIREASRHADHVFASLHEHLWPCEWKDVAYLPSWPGRWAPPAPWKREVARRMIDAGASGFLGHGVPRASGIEMHHGRPIFHSLGNFIFHLFNPSFWPMPEVWEGFVAELSLGDSVISEIRLIPIAMADAEGREDVPTMERRYPVWIRGERAEAVLRRIVADSASLGTRISVQDGIGLWKAAFPCP